MSKTTLLTWFILKSRVMILVLEGLGLQFYGYNSYACDNATQYTL